ncbi:hypothetical protein WJX84_007469 [Apatococcus fuscideae]|uniref:ABC transporter domain-containing protein n=1 Tax=Apatococcus fuscideae TaxID=2026836 RepID=A0AAW1TLZ3_9CHLO
MAAPFSDAVDCHAVGTSSELSEDSVAVSSLEWGFPGLPPVLHDFSLHLPGGSRCLLLGGNGAGKTTLLQVLAGKHMVGKDVVRIIGRSAFHDIKLTSTGELAYLGPQWRRTIASAGHDIPLQGDIGAGDMIWRVEGVDPNRRQLLVDLLGIDKNWRLNKVSDGQRRRVQICMGLLKPFQVLLLDEITVDMDVLGRLDLLNFLKEESERRHATILYATHIFDGLEPWITHVAHVANGKLVRGAKVEDVPELKRNKKLLTTAEAWLRHDRDSSQHVPEPSAQKQSTMPLMPSKHMAFYR